MKEREYLLYLKWGEGYLSIIKRDRDSKKFGKHSFRPLK